MRQSPGQPSPGPERRSARQRTIVVLGARGVGKSASVIQYVDDHFVDTYSPTIESTFRKSIRWRGEEMVLSIRDTSGQDEHTVFHARNCTGVHGFIIMYSVTSRSTFRVVEFIRDKVLTNLMGTAARVPIVLVGNKSDLDHEREVSEREGRALAQKWGCPFVESSAKHNDNIGEAFHRVLVAIHRLEDGDLEDPGCCCSVSCSCACDIQGATHNSQVCVMRLLKVTAFMTLLFGLLFASTGFGHHQRTDPTVVIITYSTVGLGMVMVLTSCVGLWGARSFSVAMLRGFGVVMCVLLVCQVAVASALLQHPNAVHVVAHSNTLVAGLAATCSLAQVGAIVFAFLGQRISQLYSGDQPAFGFQRAQSWGHDSHGKHTGVAYSPATHASSPFGGPARSIGHVNSAARSAMMLNGAGHTPASDEYYFSRS